MIAAALTLLVLRSSELASVGALVSTVAALCSHWIISVLVYTPLTGYVLGMIIE